MFFCQQTKAHHYTCQLGPTRLLPGSPTLAPPVVNAMELGCWMVLSNIDTPTAAIPANNKAARKTFMVLPSDQLYPANYSAGTCRAVPAAGTCPFVNSSCTQSE